MIIANVKSHADLSKKKQLQKDLLQVEIDKRGDTTWETRIELLGKQETSGARKRRN